MEKECLIEYGIKHVMMLDQQSFFDNQSEIKQAVVDTFDTMHEFLKEVYISIARTHADYFYTNKYWDTFARKQHFPTSNMYRKVFSKWEYAQVLVHGNLTKFQMRQNFLLEIVKKYKENFFVPSKEWNTFAKVRDLPGSATYVNHFSLCYKEIIQEILEGRLTEYSDLNLLRVKAKEITEDVPNNKRYTKENVVEILLANKEFVATQILWENHARENKLPGLRVIRKHFGSFNEMKKDLKLVNVFRVNLYTLQELINIGIEHYPYLLKKTIWGTYSEINNLPGINVLERNFGNMESFKKIVEDQLTKDNSENFKKIVEDQFIKDVFNQKMNILLELKEENFELIERLKPYWSITENKQTWNRFVEEKGWPPNYDLIVIKFHSLKKLRLVLLLSIVLEKVPLFNAKEWDDYAKQNGWPLRSYYRKNFYFNLKLLEFFLNINRKKQLELISVF